jgi:steroid delta-isomerase-like uncharacterized protein
MTSANIEVARRWFEELWNEGRAELIPELLAPDAPIYDVGAPGEVRRGPEGFRPVYEKLRGAFPDIHFTIEEIIGERDIVALRWTARATHRGPHLGFAATEASVTMGGMGFARVCDGKVVEAWNNWDMMGLLQQLGQIQQPAVVPGDGSG